MIYGLMTGQIIERRAIWYNEGEEERWREREVKIYLCL